MSTAKLWAFMAAGLVCAACASAGETTSAESGARPIPPELAGLRDRWSAALEEFSVPGFAVVVVRGDQVIYLDTFGYRDLERKLPVTPETAYYIASCTKLLTATAVLTLVEAGKLQLDDPVRKHLPRFELPQPEAAERVTVRDLLCHRPGIECGPAVFLDAYTGEITDERYYHFLKTQGTLAAKPTYSNIHYTLLGRVIEAASGKPWRDYLSDALFTPAGMRNATGYADAMYAGENVATPYELEPAGLRPTIRKCDATMHAAGGLGMSISDAARWLILNINQGEIDGRRIVTAAHAAEMQTLQAEARRGNIRVNHGFGLGWMIGTFRPDGPRYIMHSGGYTGAAAHFSFLPDQKIGVAVFTNVGAPGAIFAESVVSIDILDRFAGGEHPDFLENVRKQLPAQLPQLLERAAAAKNTITAIGAEHLTLPRDRYCGVYTHERFGTVHVERDGATLKLRIGALPLPLMRCSADAFTVAVSGSPRTGQFTIDDGQVIGVRLDLEDGPVHFGRS